MSRNTHVGIALLAGIAVVWLVPIFSALATSIPGLANVLRGVKEHGLPGEIVSWALFSLLPVAMTALLVGLVLFRLPGNRRLALPIASAPFVLYSLAVNIGLFVWAGNSLLSAASNTLPWLVAAMVPLGFFLSMLAVRQPSEA